MGLEAFGADVAEKIKQSNKVTRTKKLNMTQEIRNEIIQQMKKQLEARPDQPQTNYVREDFGKPIQYDVMLVQTYGTVEIRPTKFNPFVMMKWRGERLSAFMDANLAESLRPDTFYLFVGKYSISPGKGRYAGREFNNFSVHGIISMLEVEQHSSSQETQDEEIKEKISEHQEKPEPASVEDKPPVEKEVEIFEDG